MIYPNEELFRHVDRRENEDGSSTLVGKEYSDTHKFSIPGLLLFIERDIFKAIRENEIPSIKVEVETKKGPQVDEIQVKILDIDGLKLKVEAPTENPLIQLTDTASTFGFDAWSEESAAHLRLVIEKLSQILWKYNRFKKSTSSSSYQARFFYRIALSDHFKDRLRRSISIATQVSSSHS